MSTNTVDVALPSASGAPIAISNTGSLMLNGFSSVITKSLEGAGRIMLPSVPYVRHTELFLPLPSQLPLNHTLPTGSPLQGGRVS